MPAYAVANLIDTRFGPEIAEYLQRIDRTLAPYCGKFLIHGGEKRVLEGAWPGALIVIEFPDAQSVHDWYASTDYQTVLPLRARNATGAVMILEGVAGGYTAASKIAQLEEGV